MKLGQQLKAARKKSNLNQSQAASKIGISQTYLSQLETDTKSASPTTLDEICKAYSTHIALIIWKSVTEKDISKRKLKTYREIKPMMDKLIEEIF
ncbi:MAG: helix-turn-helix transcriptional regulator [Ferruginibacter sp.]